MRKINLNNLKKKGDLSMETIVMIVIALAVLLVIIGIFTFQSRKGSGKINDIGDGAANSASEGMCLGSLTSGGKTTELKCRAACDDEPLSEKKADGTSNKYSAQSSPPSYDNKKCMMPDQICCGYVLN